MPATAPRRRSLPRRIASGGFSRGSAGRLLQLGGLPYNALGPAPTVPTQPVFQSLRRSIQRKFLAATIGTSIAALLITATALLVYDLRSYRQSSIEQLNT